MGGGSAKSSTIFSQVTLQALKTSMVLGTLTDDDLRSARLSSANKEDRLSQTIPVCLSLASGYLMSR